MWFNLRHKIVSNIYATHNNSPQIQDALKRILSELNNQGRGLNIGAGTTNLHPKLFNLDIFPNSIIHCCAMAETLPFATESISMIITQETLEHVQEPHRAVREMYRVLKPNGILYCQLPFVIGYHPGPTDFWRFSKEGIQELVEQAGFVCKEVKIAVGPATGLYRILVEFFATIITIPVPSLYHLAKGAAALLLYPIKLLDSVLLHSPQADRIAGGYYIIAEKI